MNAEKDIFNSARVYACDLFQGKLKGSASFGWHKKSVGQKFINQQNFENWLLISQFESNYAAEAYIAQIRAANLIKKVKKPQLYDGVIFEKDSNFFTLLLMSYIEDHVCSDFPLLEKEIELSDNWFVRLRYQLDSLSKESSNYISCRQDLVNRRIKERYGDIKCHIEHWATIHGDINWTNLTISMPYILDWEGWGIGPKGLDIAFLYCFSLPMVSINLKIKECFHEWFNTKDSKICLLFVCSELTRMIELYNDHPTLKIPLYNLSKKILDNDNYKL